MSNFKPWFIRWVPSESETLGAPELVRFREPFHVPAHLWATRKWPRVQKWQNMHRKVTREQTGKINSISWKTLVKLFLQKSKIWILTTTLSKWIRVEIWFTNDHISVWVSNFNYWFWLPYLFISANADQILHDLRPLVAVPFGPPFRD